jgi:hypothetical protein
MSIEKPLVVGHISYIANDKPVVVVFPDTNATEFSSVEAAREHLKIAALFNPFIQPARVFNFEDDTWIEV